MKKIKMKLMDIHNASRGLAELLTLPLPMDICYKVAKLSEQLMKEQEIIETVRLKKRKEYITPEDDLEIIEFEKAKKGEKTPEEIKEHDEKIKEKTREFRKEFGKFLMENKVEIVMEKYIDLSDSRLQNINFQTRYMVPLLKFFTVK